VFTGGIRITWAIDAAVARTTGTNETIFLAAKQAALDQAKNLIDGLFDKARRERSAQSTGDFATEMSMLNKELESENALIEQAKQRIRSIENAKLALVTKRKFSEAFELMDEAHKAQKQS
jgi:signal transduction histidine kinase